MSNWHRIGLLYLLLMALLLCETPAHTQEVRASSSGYGWALRQGNNAAEKQNRTDWPRVNEGDSGTQVRLTFDIRNADITLLCAVKTPLTSLLPEAQKIAKELGLPQADFITAQGRKSVAVDIELNDYLQRQNRRTDFTLDLHRLVQTLERSKALPRPIILLVNPEEADMTELSAPGATAPRRLETFTFLSLEEVPQGAQLHFTAAIAWYAYLIATFMVGIGLFTVVMMVSLPWRMRRFKLRAAEVRTAPIPDPQEVQEKYNRQRPIWLIPAALPVVFILLSLFGDPKRFLSSAFRVLPMPSDTRLMMLLPLGMMALIGLSALVCALWYRRRGLTETNIPEPADDPDTPPRWTFMVGIWPLMAAMMIMPLMLFIPGLRNLETNQRLAIIFGIVGVCFLTSMGISLYAKRFTQTILGPESPWFQMVQEVAIQAGVRVRKVIQVRSPLLNAGASLFGNVILTSALLHKMELEEVRAVIAHEIGHLKAGHVRRTFLLSLTVLALFFVVWWYGTEMLKSRVPEFTFHLLRSPLVTIFLLPILMNLLLGRRQRRHEEEADRFAVQVIGDPELVIRALTKLHTLDAVPHELKPVDEVLSSHPSLKHRVEAIRNTSA